MIRSGPTFRPRSGTGRGSSQRRSLRSSRRGDGITASLETIEDRITAHHGHYADARENLDGSLKLLSNAVDIYEHADEANGRLLNPALFKTIYIDEENDVASATATHTTG